MTKEELLKKVLTSDELPTLPNVASELITLTAREDTTLSDIASLVSKDVSLSAKILKVSNSAFYSFPQQIGSINQAVSILGINAVRSLVLSFSFLTMRAGKVENRFNFKLFWERSLASAVAAKLILEQVKGADTEEIFVSGLLQNLGELILARTFPHKYGELLELLETGELTTEAAEEKIFGTTHAYIGTEVARNWKFPEKLLAPIQYHHEPETYPGSNAAIKATISAVHLSTLLTNILYSDKPEQYHKEFRKRAGKMLHLSSEKIEYIMEQFHHRVKETGTYFNLKIQSSRSIQEILQEANIRLSLINLDYDQMNKELIQAKIRLENLTKELESKNKILDNLASIDGLTGVYNHRYFQTALDQEINRAIRKETSISILFADIDYFKKFNDTYGHQVGDFVLTEVAATLRNNIRDYDTVARYGGEEFVIILPETGTEEALIVAEKLRAAIEQKVFKDAREQYQVTTSFGQACAKPASEEAFDKNEFINQADQALYEAKEKGRNRVARYTPKKKWFSF